VDARPGTFREMWFSDFAAAARSLDPLPAVAEGSRAERIGPYARASLWRLGEFLGSGLEGGWEPMVGFSLHEMEAQLSWGQAYDRGLVLRLAPGAAERVEPALLAGGYAAETRDGLSAFANAVRDGGTIGLDELTPELRAHPLQGPLGYASRVAVDGPLLLSASDWPTLLALAGRGAPQGHPDLPALAAVIDDPAWGATEVIQATLLPHQLDLATPGERGIPVWDLGVLVDLGSGTETVGLLLLSYRSEADAQEAARRIADAWGAPRQANASDFVAEVLAQPPGADLPDPAALPAQPSLAETIGLPVETGVAGDGPFVTWAALRGVPEQQDGWLRNPGYHGLYLAMIQRRLGLLGPG
jgi:hypothetical protein